MSKTSTKQSQVIVENISSGVGEYLLASKRCEIAALQKLLSMGPLLAAISRLVHALQFERGASNLYLGFGGSRCGEARERRVLAACSAEKDFRHCLAEAVATESSPMAGDSRLFSRIAYAIHGLDELRSIRADIAALKTEPEVIIDGYSELIQSLLAIVYETADSAADPDISRVLVALFHLMQGKELAGQERAVGTAGFAQGVFNSHFPQRLHRLIESQDRCFQIFLDFAEPELVESWQRLAHSECSAKLERLRRIAFSSAAKGKADRELSDVWFTLASERMDVLSDMERHLEQSLGALCQQKLAQAKEDLLSHSVHLDELAMQSGAPAFAVFFRQNAPNSSQESSSEAYTTGCAGPQLGRSLFDLVQSQASRLQTMTEELEAARAALAERKTIEKAKGLIMKNRSVSEDQAYRFMRQVAMAQNRRLIEVAKDTLAMSDLFALHAED